MTDRALLDTDIFSEILKGRDPSVLMRSGKYLEEHRILTVSAITVVEITRGLRVRKLTELLRTFEESLSTAEVLPLSRSTAILAGEILAALDRVGRPVGAYDPLIAAIAMDNDLELITGNTDHFRYIAEQGFPLRISNWREPVT